MLGISITRVYLYRCDAITCDWVTFPRRSMSLTQSCVSIYTDVTQSRAIQLLPNVLYVITQPRVSMYTEVTQWGVFELPSIYSYLSMCYRCRNSIYIYIYIYVYIYVYIYIQGNSITPHCVTSIEVTDIDSTLLPSQCAVDVVTQPRVSNYADATQWRMIEVPSQCALCHNSTRRVYLYRGDAMRRDWVA